MIFISELASQRVKEILVAEGKEDGYFVRVSVKGGGCSGLSYDIQFDNNIQSDDQFFESNSVQI